MRLLALAGLLWLVEIQPSASQEPTTPPALTRFEFSEVHMGATFKLIFYAPDEDLAKGAAQEAFELIERLNGVLSDYDPESELSRLSATSGQGEKVPVSDDLWRILLAARGLSDRSEGAFDVTVGPYVKLWRRARRGKQLPSPERMAEARQAVSYQFLKLDESQQTAELTQPKMLLDLGGIAVGYTVDRVLELFTERGITRALVDGSGDVGVSDAPPDAPGWKIGVAPVTAPDGAPTRFVWLKHAAITTSGDAFQYVELDGVRYSHIVDPKTGLGLTHREAATVIAADCITADSLATAVCVLGPDKGLRLVDQTSGTSALVMRVVDGKVETSESPGFRDFESTRDAPVPPNGDDP